MAVAGLSTPASYVVVLPNSATTRATGAAARSSAVLVASQNAAIDGTIAVSVGEFHAFLSRRNMIVHDTIYGAQIGTISLANYRCCTGSARVEATGSPISHIWGI